MASVQHLARGSALPPLKKDTWRLYSMRWCPYAQRTRLVLWHKHIPHETVNVNLKLKPMWLFERNPLGLVPVLEYNDLVLHESAVCDDFLDDLVPTPRLTPRDPVDRAKQRVVMERFQQVIAAFYQMNRGGEESEKAKRRMARGFQYYEHLIPGKFFGGAEPCMVDFHIWPWIERLPAIHQLSGYECMPSNQFPKLNQWKENMMDVEAVQKIWEPPEKHMQFLAALFSGQPNYDFEEDATAKL